MEKAKTKQLLYYCEWKGMKSYSGAPITHLKFLDVKTGTEVTLRECWYSEEVSELLGGHYYDDIANASKDYYCIWKLTDEKVSPIDTPFEQVREEYKSLSKAKVPAAKIYADLMAKYSKVLGMGRSR